MADQGTRGGSHDQKAKADEKKGHEETTQGGTHEQHVKAGQQSHKNS